MSKNQIKKDAAQMKRNQPSHTFPVNSDSFMPGLFRVNDQWWETKCFCSSHNLWHVSWLLSSSCSSRELCGSGCSQLIWLRFLAHGAISCRNLWPADAMWLHQRNAEPKQNLETHGKASSWFTGSPYLYCFLNPCSENHAVSLSQEQQRLI